MTLSIVFHLYDEPMSQMAKNMEVLGSVSHDLPAPVTVQSVTHSSPSCLPCRVFGFQLSLGTLALLILLSGLGIASHFLNE
jgi:hypothetical protein